MGIGSSFTRMNLVTFAISMVWLINGLCCKVLHLVPRHEFIVARILGSTYAPVLTKVIGLAEIALAITIACRIHPRLMAYFQILLVLSMNIIEWIYAPDLLLFGGWNLALACCFCLLVYYDAFFLRNPIAHV